MNRMNIKAHYYIPLITLLLAALCSCASYTVDALPASPSPTPDIVSAPGSNGTNLEIAEEIETPSPIEEMKITSPQAALDALKEYIENRSDGSEVFDRAGSSADYPAYHFKGSNFWIEYDHLSEDENGIYYIIHEYETVIDDPEIGEGHVATSNWIRVDAQTGDISYEYNYDGSANW